KKPKRTAATEKENMKSVLRNIWKKCKKCFKNLRRQYIVEKLTKWMTANSKAMPRKEKKLLKLLLVLFLKKKRKIFISEHKSRPRKKPSKTNSTKNQEIKSILFSKVAGIMLFLK